MGQPKQLLSWGGKTVLEHVLDSLASAGLTDIVVVLGFRAQAIAGRLTGRPVKLVVNRYFRCGMSSSIRAALKHVPAGSGIMLFLADQPLVGPDILARLVAEFERGERGIVVPVHRGRRGNPVIFHPRYRDEMSKLQGDIGAREIVAAHEDDVAEVETSEAVLWDIDTAQDYRLAREIEKGKNPNGTREQAQ